MTAVKGHNAAPSGLNASGSARDDEAGARRDEAADNPRVPTGRGTDGARGADASNISARRVSAELPNGATIVRELRAWIGR
jgi:hypothetical protein